MILAIDIGNTNIVLGGFDDEKLRFISRISTNAKKTDAEYATKLKSILSLYGVDESEVSEAAISSVVPILTQTMANAIPCRRAAQHPDRGAGAVHHFRQLFAIFAMAYMMRIHSRPGILFSLSSSSQMLPGLPQSSP